MPAIQIVAFRGTGGVFDETSPYHNEPALIRAGHVAVAGVMPGALIGFSPSPDAVQIAGTEAALLEKLQRHIAQAGILQDDSSIFRRAAELAEDGARCSVWQVTVNITDETLEQIKAWYNQQKMARYNFPDDEGKFAAGEYNCATFWDQFDMETPADTGSIKNYVRAMKLKGATQWHP